MHETMNKSNLPKWDRSLVSGFKTTVLFLKRLVTNRLLLKVLSVFFAIILWGYISTATNPEVKKNFRKVPVKINGENILNNAGFATKLDIADILPKGISVEAGIGIKDYKNALPVYLVAEMDLSSIKSTGIHRVQINVRSLNPDMVIKSYLPLNVDIDIDKYVTKNIHVEIDYKKELSAGIWRGEATLNPQIVTVSGPESKVERITRAYISIDQSILSSSLNGDSYKVRFMDKANKIISDEGLNISSNIGVTLDIRSKKELLLDLNGSLLNSDKLSQGYEIVDKSYSYSDNDNKIIVLGSNEILSGIGDTIKAEPIDLTGMKAPIISLKRKLILPEGVTAVNGDTVNISVNIAEKTLTRTLDAAVIFLTPKSWRYEIKAFDVSRISLTATGPYHILNLLGDDTITANIDLRNLGEGVHNIPVVLANVPKGISCNIEISSVRVTIKRK